MKNHIIFVLISILITISIIDFMCHNEKIKEFDSKAVVVELSESQEISVFNKKIEIPKLLGENIMVLEYKGERRKFRCDEKYTKGDEISITVYEYYDKEEQLERIDFIIKE